MQDGLSKKEKCFVTARGLISFGVLIITFLIMSVLNGAIVEAGIPPAYEGFVTVAFSLLPILMVLSWISFCWKWPNIFWLAMPLTVATFLMLFLYEYLWVPKYNSTQYSDQYQQIMKMSDQSWGCENGWSVARLPAQAEGKTVLRYILLSGSRTEPPYGLATNLGNGEFQIARHQDIALQAKIRQILRSCEGEELTLVKNLYFETLPERNNP